VGKSGFWSCGYCRSGVVGCISALDLTDPGQISSQTVQIASGQLWEFVCRIIFCEFCRSGPAGHKFVSDL
jgi:hypothetical protein